MKRKIFIILTLIVGVTVAAFLLHEEISAKGFADHFNFPKGRQDSSGLLTIYNPSNATVVLFHTVVCPENFIGIVGPLISITVKLPDDNLFVIISVEENDYKERGSQALPYSSHLVYYSSTTPYEVKLPTGLTRDNTLTRCSEFSNANKNNTKGGSR